jgi:general secretion pathway protein J
MSRRVRRARERGLTLIEIIVSLAILAMMSVLLYGAFDSMSRGKKAEALRADRAREGREASARIVRELQGAFLSLHQPTNPSLITRNTAFVGQSSSDFDRLDFTSFAHRRIGKESHESDQAEIGYFVVKDPDVDGKFDLVRREQTPIDFDPLRGGVVSVVAEDVETFDVKYLDPMTGNWVETWDTTQLTGQPGRLPWEVKVTIALKSVRNSPPFAYTTKTTLPIMQPLNFGFPR